MSKAIRFAACLFTLLLLFGCASRTTPARTIEAVLTEMEMQRAENISRISNYRINGWRSIDDSSLIITAGLKEYYLVTLLGPCFGLRDAFSIGYTTTAGSLDRFESILVEGPGSRMEFCRINNITRLRNLHPE